MRQTLMSKKMGGVQFAGLVMMTFAFVINLLVFVIMTVEIFHVFRLMTASSAGFDFAKTYYMNADVTCMRHFAMRAFFLNVPLLCVAMGCKVWAHLGDMNGQYIYASITCCVLGVAAIALVIVYVAHRRVFHKVHCAMMQHTEPLLTHMADFHRTGVGSEIT